MPPKISLRQLQPHAEDLQTDDDARGFLRDRVLPVPLFRVDDVEGGGAGGDADESGERRFGQVKAVADAAAEDGVEEEEEGEDEVGEVGRGRFELFAEPGTHYFLLLFHWMSCSAVVTR